MAGTRSLQPSGAARVPPEAVEPQALGSSRKARSNTTLLAGGRVTLKQLLRTSLEQGLSAPSPLPQQQHAAATLPRSEGAPAIKGHRLSNAGLFERPEPWTQQPICRI